MHCSVRDRRLAGGIPSPAAKASSMASARAGVRGRRPAHARGPGAIRWDRVGRVALLATFCGILILYVGPARSWYSTWRQEKAHTAEVKRLRVENRRLRDQRRLLSRPATL